jgi:ketosteroid isomerase-like protein
MRHPLLKAPLGTTLVTSVAACLAASLVAGLVAGLAACGSAAVDAPGPAPVDPRLYQDAGARVVAHVKTPEEVQAAEREAVSAVLAGYAEDEFKSALPRLDPEGNLSFPGMSEATDRDADVKALAELFGAFAGRAFAQGRVWQAPGVTVVEWTMTGTHAREWMGVKPTQKAVTIRGLGLFFFDVKGLVNDTHLYFDVGATLAQLGAGPKGIEAPAAATAPAAVVVAASGSEPEKQNVALVNASWDALEARSEAGYLAPFADDVEVTRLDRANPERGKADRKKFYKWATSGIGSLAQTPLNAWGIGSFVVEEYSITGVHSGKLTEVAPSGHALRLRYVDVDELKDGKVVHTWTYGNSLELYAQVGQVDRAAPGATSAVIK